MTPQEWDRLPWYEARMYLEGYRWEGIISDPDDNPSMPDPSGEPQGLVPIDPSDLSGMGFTESFVQ